MPCRASVAFHRLIRLVDRRKQKRNEPRKDLKDSISAVDLMRRCHVSFQIRDQDSFHATVTSMVVLLSLLRYVNGPDWTDCPSQTGNLTEIHVLIVSIPRTNQGDQGAPFRHRRVQDPP